ncbi:hypothetical protein DASC09_022840 [Saccharomycopsis crataegensis]|uniref:Fumarylacetoacetase-like C-terminal domain-containing protein n=1 Tax=Saccharomycopsis crataegensis TaxID=43959 RepID=A0AAV5QJQ0_9ASCO|nr:hypothetical protein DASC09_022840 [Saccharomycopsis crataegensis]
MSFKRLIRFVSTDSKVYFGDAIVPSTTTPETFDPRFTKEAHVIVGDVFSSSYTITNQIKPVAQLLCPIAPSQLGTVRLIGLNYSKHAAELGSPKPKFPVGFYKPATAAAGPNDSIIVPRFAQVVGNPNDPKDTKPQVDYETELVVVIGKAGTNIPKDKVSEYILGYSVGNDVSQRTWQIARGGSQFTTGKMFDTWAPFGPAIVSPSVVGNPNDLQISSYVNGELRQDSTTGDMIFDVVELVHFLSQGTTLMPGDIIWTGTPGGVAAGMKDPKWLQDGDVCVCKLEKVGTVQNKVVFEKDGFRDWKL